MTKKKRQADHSIAGDSSDSNESEHRSSLNNCVHVNKATVAGVSRKLQGSWPLECFDCNRLAKKGIPNGHTTPVEATSDDDDSLYICLRCGQTRCGGPIQHAQNHSKNTQNEVHDVALNPKNWTVWCFQCNAEIPNNSTKQLLETIESIKKMSYKVPKGKEEPPVENEVPATTTTTYRGSFVLAPVPVASASPSGLPKVRGLQNLGNTCFMNAVLQCLAQTPFLLPELEEMREAGEKFRLPGGEVQIGDNKEELDPLEGELGEWGSLTSALAETLRELQSGSSNTLVPRPLLSQLHDKCPQFQGFAEHDSHELLRQLLDTVRTEDLQRYQQGILRELGCKDKHEREHLTDRMKQIIKCYGRQASDLHLRPSRVFRGELVSTLVCQKCKHATDHIEHFLDLSLPVVADKPVHVRRRQSEDSESVPSKHQLKKDRKAARKRSSRHYKQTAIPGQVSTTEGELQSEGSNGDSDADAEDEAESESTERRIAIPRGSALGRGDASAKTQDDVTSDPPGEGERKVSLTCRESNSSSPVLTDTSNHEPSSLVLEKSEASPCIDNDRNSDNEECKQQGDTDEAHGLTDPEAGADAALPAVHTDVVESGYSSEKPGNGDSLCGSPSSERPPHLDALHSDMSGLHVCNDPDGLAKSVGADESDADGELDEICTGATLAPRVYTPSGECTLISCLNQFTAQELLTGNNKVGCDACTERTHGKGGKTLYTDASKQLLIHSPPAILILHLKRFQVLRFTSRKNSEEVKFPNILDLAPFCSAKCRSTPSVRRDQREIRYALYGVVQHSGNMHGGHYVAYVKTRPSLDKDSPRWQFLPGGNVSSLQDEDGLPDPPPGQWYYVSDSYVSASSEARVLDSEGYVLFYERIW